MRRKPPPIKTKQDWQERFKNIRIGKRGHEDTEKSENSKMAYAIFDENLYLIREREVFHSEVCYLLVFHMLCQRYRLLLFFLFFYLFIYFFFV